MIIDYNNRDLLETLVLSDSVFEGFAYGYNSCDIRFTCMNYYQRKRFFFCFQQVIMFSMQSCNFWGMGNAIYDFRCNEGSALLVQLMRIKSENSQNLDKSKVDSEKQFLCVSLQLNSGDELQIICERIDISSETIIDFE